MWNYAHKVIKKYKYYSMSIYWVSWKPLYRHTIYDRNVICDILNLCDIYVKCRVLLYSGVVLKYLKATFHQSARIRGCCNFYIWNTFLCIRWYLGFALTSLKTTNRNDRQLSELYVVLHCIWLIGLLTLSWTWSYQFIWHV